MIWPISLEVRSTILKNAITNTLWFKQLGQTELMGLERDLQSISWTSSFLIGGFIEVLNYMLYFYDILYNINKLANLDGKYTKRGVDIEVTLNTSHLCSLPK